MDGWMDGWMDKWMDGRMDGWIDGWMDGGKVNSHVRTMPASCIVVTPATVGEPTLTNDPLPTNASPPTMFCVCAFVCMCVCVCFEGGITDRPTDRQTLTAIQGGARTVESGPLNWLMYAPVCTITPAPRQKSRPAPKAASMP
jgi:hypothetical protein